jgi:Polyketide cyclase / dehydrase and lipid transport
MRDLNFYRFRATWHVGARPDDAYAVLQALGDYPAWWPEVKEIHQYEDGHYDVRCRSLLPYDLVFSGRQSQRDPAGRVLEAKLWGDLEGFSRWTIEPSGGGSRLLFEEEVVTNKPVLRRLAAIARPLFKLNHALMMSRGQKGLRTYLDGYGRGRRDSLSSCS